MHPVPWVFRVSIPFADNSSNRSPWRRLASPARPEATHGGRPRCSSVSKVRADEVLLVVETEKTTVDVLASAGGVLFSIVVAVGETAEVSSIQAVIDDEG